MHPEWKRSKGKLVRLTILFCSQAQENENITTSYLGQVQRSTVASVVVVAVKMKNLLALDGKQARENALGQAGAHDNDIVCLILHERCREGRTHGSVRQHEQGMKWRRTRANACHLDTKGNGKTSDAVALALTMFGYCKCVFGVGCGVCC